MALEPLGKSERRLHAACLRESAREVVAAAYRAARDMIVTATRIHPEGIVPREEDMSIVADLLTKATLKIQTLQASLNDKTTEGTALREQLGAIQGQVQTLQGQVSAMADQARNGVLDDADVKAIQEIGAIL